MAGFEAAGEHHRRKQEKFHAHLRRAHDVLPKVPRERFPMKTPKEAKKAGESSIEYLYSNFAHYCQLVKRAASFAPRDYLPIVRSRKEYQSLFRRANRYFRPYDVTDLVFKEYNNAAVVLGLKASERKKKIDGHRKELKALPEPERTKRLEELERQAKSLGEYREDLTKKIATMEGGVTAAVVEASTGLKTLVENPKAQQSLEILTRLGESGIAFPELPPDASDEVEKKRATISLVNVEAAVRHFQGVQNAMRPLTEVEKPEDDRRERFASASTAVQMAIDEVNNIMQELSSPRLKTLSSALRQKHRVDSSVLKDLRGKQKSEKRKELNANRDTRRKDLDGLKALRKELLEFRKQLLSVRRLTEKTTRTSRRDLPKIEIAIAHLATGQEISEIPTRLLPLLNDQVDRLGNQIKQGTTDLVGLPYAKREEIQKEQRNYHAYLQSIVEDWQGAVDGLDPRAGESVRASEPLN